MTGLLALAACGQRGPLTLPDRDAPPPAEQTETEPERDGDEDER